MITPGGAAGAYASFAKVVNAVPSAGLGEGEASFGQMVEAAVGGVADKGRIADKSAAEAIAGKGDIVDVVTAVAESEVALETLVSVRDKVIQAYEDIMRMPI